MRKYLSIFILLFLLTIPFGALAEENLLSNGDFSEMAGSLPANWSTEFWYSDEGTSTLEVVSDGYSGNAIHITNFSENDARFAQTVAVQPDTLYRISCMCKAENVGSAQCGAGISIRDTFSYSEPLYDTEGEWVRVELYGRTGADQTELTVLARIGGYGYLNSGSAWFDNFEMIEIDSAPDEAIIEDFDPESLGSSNNSVSFSDFAEEETIPERNTETYLLLTCIYMLAVLGFARKYSRKAERKPFFYRCGFIAMLGGAFLLRAYLAVSVHGYHTDINCFTAWSEQIFKVGLSEFYSNVWCDYPPGYMLMLWPIAALRRLFGLATNSGAYLLLLKLWPILFDLAGAWLVWHCAKPKLGARAALMLSAFFALNPAIFTDSAAWGQIDSVFTLLIVLCALQASEENYISSLVCFALAVLIKPQALLFAPLGLFAVIIFYQQSSLNRYIEQNLYISKSDTNPSSSFLRAYPAVHLLTGIAAALGILYLGGLLFTIGTSEGLIETLVRPVTWLIDLYGSTMNGYQYITVNTLNLYYLFGLNWKSAESYSTIMTVAWVLFAASYLYCCVLCLFSKDRKHLLLIGGLLIVLICTFGPMIHERYIYPAVLLLTLGYVYSRDRRILISLTVLSATLFLNEFLVLQGGMTEANYGHLQESEHWLNAIVSFLNVVNALYLSWTALDICILDHVIVPNHAPTETEPYMRRELTCKRDHKLHLKRHDVLLMAVTTLIYSAVAFTNLGTTSAPQTTWVSSAANEQIVFDLGETQRFHMTYYGGICSSNFTVELSNDGENWTEPYYAKYNQGEIFRWLWYVPQTESGANAAGPTVPTEDGSAFVAFAGYEGESEPFQTARYIRLTTVAAGLELSEVGFLDENGEALPIASVKACSDSIVNDVALLADEQDTIPAHPSYYNSTYFDEIYHARTAYEHLHGRSTYEWTHPPLGKVLMMIGIQIFGMTPFGWRFMGTLMGVLMLPLMYLLVKQLTKSSKLSFIAMFLMSVDSMHFTQTRIATIDSYAVFWIMLMYFFMFRYCQMRWTSPKEFLHSLITLGLCGVTMGVAWATKWIGLYASVGLAILFFWTLWKHWQEYRYVKKHAAEDGISSDETDYLREYFWSNAVGTIVFCLFFFVIIPVVIYYFSYYWHLQNYGVTCLSDMFSMEHVKTVAKLQESILNYHAGLGGDTHYFRSPWYQWPIIWWPMWYYSGTGYMPDGMISSISCMGNPAVWWFGLIALIFVVVRMCMMRRAPKSYVMVVIGFASQFLPWVLVPRSTFIYHYFASVPFIIMASVLMLKWINQHSETAFRAVTITLMTLALGLFIAFYPLESGLPTYRAYAQYLRWFKWYNF